jgi:hypothetical protein
LGEPVALAYLKEMLDDADIDTPRSHTPGQSIRAAQAVADVLGFPFEWGKQDVAKVKARLAQSQE